jgi:hypothetical protein
MRIVVPLVLSSALLLIGCVPQSADPAPPPAPARPPLSPPPPPLAPVSDNWQDVPVTPGGWIWRADARGSVAMFGVAGIDAQFVARCDLAARRIYLSRPGLLAAGQEAIMAITTSAGTGSYRAQPTGGTPPYIAAQTSATDPFLDKMAFSRGRFVVATTGLARLVMPAWPEFGRVIEDCRK